jgi:DNA-binding NarL/FixJ family response regulator
VCVARVLVVDDIAGFRDAICSMLSDRPDLLVVAEASDGLEAVRKAEELQPDLIVPDLSMPKLNGLEATRRIRTVSPSSRIIIVSLESSADFVREALRSGAGCVIKAEIANQLLPAVEAVSRVNAGSLRRWTIFADGSNARTKRRWALRRWHAGCPVL